MLDALLPQYVGARIYNCLLQAAASEQAARQRAMKSASDNAEELIRLYTRLANQARQAEITQEISEIVGGADALASVREPPATSRVPKRNHHDCHCQREGRSADDGRASAGSAG